ncbi:P-loop containing nucleoside triphosphate hydrolase protein, partial [Violaceomyces palustris]
MPRSLFSQLARPIIFNKQASFERLLIPSNRHATITTIMSSSTPIIPEEKRPIVLSGPSGVGKSTLLKRLFQEFPDDFGFSVSHTTRQPRQGETRGESYHYVTEKEFLDLVDKGAFLEHAKFGDNRYGTTVKAVTD